MSPARFSVPEKQIGVADKATTMTRAIVQKIRNALSDFCKKGVNMRRRGTGTVCIAMFPSTLVEKDERQFHWEIMVSEKSERHSAVPGIRYRVKPHLTQGWVFEKVHVADVKNVPGLLARILVADIVDADLVDRIVCTTPLVLGDREWRCYDWVKDVLSKLAAAEDRAVLPAVAAGVEGYVAVMKPAEGVAGDDGATTGTGTTVNAVDGGATDTVEGAAAGDAPTGDGIAPDDGAAVVADGDFIAEKDAGSMDVQLGEPTDQDEIVYISVFTELDWDTIKAVARRYVEDKIVAGRYTCFEDIEKPRPTYCMITSQEYWV